MIMPSSLNFIRKPLFNANVVLFLLVVSGVSQTNTNKLLKPDFSGTWVFEKSSYVLLSNSDFINYTSRFVITQQSFEIRVAEKSLMESINKKTGNRTTILDVNVNMLRYLDGRGEVNTLPNGTSIHSKTEWKDRKLRTTYFSGPTTDLKRKILGMTEMEISKDGQKLVLTKKAAENHEFSIGTFKVQDPNNRKDTYKRS